MAFPGQKSKGHLQSKECKKIRQITKIKGNA
jgi:hypothetical protein